MPLADLLSTIQRDADAEIRGVLAEADADAARIEREAAHDRAERRRRDGEACGAELQLTADADVARADRDARVRTLTARAEMLERLRERTRARLPEVLDADVGRALLDAVLACGDTGTLRCAPALVDDARAVAPPAIAVTADAAVGHGAELALPTGTRVVATLEALLDREWPRLAARALEVSR